ncbi:MAG TPA: hypothetical protein VIG26_06355 [Methyloceanibacter sp.]|jgi:hypothetical protein
MRSLVFALTLVAIFAAPAGATDDWSFIAGNYAVDPADCATINKGKPFSKQWVEALGEDVLTQAGITSPREVHCKFRSSAKGQKGWTVNADCEEMGEGAPYDLAVTANEDGSLAVANEDVWGPEAVVFKLCPK